MENKNLLKRKRFRAKDEHGNKVWDITAVSAVSAPAIEKNFQYFTQLPGFNLLFQKTPEVKKSKFKITDEEKMEITGPAMVPNQDILRFDEETQEYYYCYFEEEDVDAFMEMFLNEANHRQANLEHSEIFTDKIFLKESWKVRDPNNSDASAMGFKDLKKGMWFITYKCSDREMWEQLKKSGLKGFSVEISLNDETELENDIEDIIEDLLLSKQEKLSAVKDIVTYHSFIEVGELSFADYPAQAVENAKRALEYRANNPDSNCGNKLLWTRCRQIANRQPLSYSNLKRISLNVKHESKANAASYDQGCSKVIWDAFGGTDLVYWSINKLQQIDSLLKAEQAKASQEKKTPWGIR